MPTYFVERIVVQTYAVEAQDEGHAKDIALTDEGNNWSEQFVDRVDVVGEADWDD